MFIRIRGQLGTRLVYRQGLVGKVFFVRIVAYETFSYDLVSLFVVIFNIVKEPE